MAVLRASRSLLFLLPVLILVACGGGIGQQGDNGVLVIEGAMVFTSPGVPPIEDGTVVILDGVIEAVGPRGTVPIPANSQLLDGTNLSLLAGFWNVHVQIDEEILLAADRACIVAKRRGRGRIATATEGLELASEFTLSEPTPVDPPTIGL